MMATVIDRTGVMMMARDTWPRRLLAALADSTRAFVRRTSPDEYTWARSYASRAHAAESHLVHAQDATATATMLQNLGPVLEALHTVKDAVIRVGALLIIKVDGLVTVYQLTDAQQLRLDHQPQLVQSPRGLLEALQLDESSTHREQLSERLSQPLRQETQSSSQENFDQP